MAGAVDFLIVAVVVFIAAVVVVVVVDAAGRSIHTSLYTFSFSCMIGAGTPRLRVVFVEAFWLAGRQESEGGKGPPNLCLAG